VSRSRGQIYGRTSFRHWPPVQRVEVDMSGCYCFKIFLQLSVSFVYFRLFFLRKYSADVDPIVVYTARRRTSLQVGLQRRAFDTIGGSVHSVRSFRIVLKVCERDSKQNARD